MIRIKTKRILIIQFQFVNPKSVFRWEKINWFKKSWSANCIAIGPDLQTCFDEECLVATVDFNVKNDYRSYAVDSYVQVLRQPKIKSYETSPEDF